MSDQKPKKHVEKRELAREGRRPYVKPAIEEEEAFETCAVLACGLKPGGTGACGPAPTNT